MSEVVLKTLSKEWILGKSNYVLFAEALKPYIRKSVGAVKYPIEVMTDGEELGVILPSVLGRSLFDWDKETSVPLIEARICLLYQLAQAMSELFDLGLFHGNLHPELVIVTDNGEVLLHEPGVALCLNKTVKREAVLGSFNYLSPEVIDQREFSVQSDTYAFGVIAYELLTGRHPLKEKMDLLHVRTDIPEVLNYVVMGCLKTSANDRLGWLEVMQGLEQLLKSSGFWGKERVLCQMTLSKSDLQGILKEKKNTLLLKIYDYLSESGEIAIKNKNHLYGLLAEYKNLFSVDEELERIYEILADRYLGSGSKKLRKGWRGSKKMAILLLILVVLLVIILFLL